MTPYWQYYNDAPMTMGHWLPNDDTTMTPQLHRDNDALMTMRQWCPNDIATMTLQWQRDNGFIVPLSSRHHSLVVDLGVSLSHCHWCFIDPLSLGRHCRIIIWASLLHCHWGVIVALFTGTSLSDCHRGGPLLHCDWGFIVALSFVIRASLSDDNATTKPHWQCVNDAPTKKKCDNGAQWQWVNDAPTTKGQWHPLRQRDWELPRW